MKWLLKKIFGRQSFIYQTLKAYKRFGFAKPAFAKSISGILSDYNRHKNGVVSFVQIGSNDGLSGDPLHDFIMNNNWTGILVEPMPLLFEQLKKNYSSCPQKLVFANVAISNHNGEASFYYVSNEDASLP